MEQYVYTYDSFAQRGAEQYVPTERFQVKSSVYLPASDIDLRTGRLQPDRQRRRRKPPKGPGHPDSGASKLWCQQKRKPDSQNQIRNRGSYKIRHGAGAADNAIGHQLYGNHKIPR